MRAVVWVAEPVCVHTGIAPTVVLTNGFKSSSSSTAMKAVKVIACNRGAGSMSTSEFKSRRCSCPCSLALPKALNAAVIAN